MSIYARSRRMTSKCTIWALQGGGDYDDSFGAPRTISCNFRTSGDMTRDDEGIEFSPAATFRFFKDPSINKGDMIVDGESLSAKPTGGAERVRQIVTKTPLRGGTSYTILTG